MTAFMSLHEAVAAHLKDGDTVAMEGFTHLIPFAAGHEVIRQRRTGLTLIRMTPDLIYDQMIGMGCADRLDAKISTDICETPPPTAEQLGTLRNLQARTARAHGDDA